MIHFGIMHFSFGIYMACHHSPSGNLRATKAEIEPSARHVFACTLSSALRGARKAWEGPGGTGAGGFELDDIGAIYFHFFGQLIVIQMYLVAPAAALGFM